LGSYARRHSHGFWIAGTGVTGPKIQRGEGGLSARGFTHPHFGHEVRIEQFGREVRLTFTAGTEAQADSLFDTIGRQLEAGALNLTMMGKATSIERT
jgi:hypothetical protein